MANDSRRTAGFRFFWTDSIVLASGAVGAALLWKPLPQAAALVAFVVGHFFLFCNVFRVRRGYELAWAGVFLANAGTCLALGRFEWALAIQLPVTVVVVAAEVGSPLYHGVLCRRVNAANVERWLRGETARDA